MFETFGLTIKEGGLKLSDPVPEYLTKLHCDLIAPDSIQELLLTHLAWLTTESTHEAQLLMRLFCSAHL